MMAFDEYLERRRRIFFTKMPFSKPPSHKSSECLASDSSDCDDHYDSESDVESTHSCMGNCTEKLLCLNCATKEYQARMFTEDRLMLRIQRS